MGIFIASSVGFVMCSAYLFFDGRSVARLRQNGQIEALNEDESAALLKRIRIGRIISLFGGVFLLISLISLSGVFS